MTIQNDEQLSLPYTCCAQRGTRRRLAADENCCRALGVVTAVGLVLVTITTIIQSSSSKYPWRSNLLQHLRPLRDNAYNASTLEPFLSSSERWRERRRRLNTDVQHRSVLVIRMLDQVEDAEAEATARTLISQALFEGGTTTTMENGQESETTTAATSFPSVRQQMFDCSAGAIVFESVGITSVVVDTVPPPLLYERNAWVEATAAIVMQDAGFVEMAAAGSASSTTPSSEFVADPATQDFLSRMRAAADHVVLVLPPSYPDATFLAHAEVNHSISVFSSTWTSSLSAYMHELGHNIMLRHAGGIHSRELYGDTTGYMGRSAQTTGKPLKCYNAAQHWILGWYKTELRYSLLTDNPATPVRLDVAAFVDHYKIDNSDGVSDSNAPMVVLVQIDQDTYLQFNRAKAYNAHTGMMADQVVMVRDNYNSTRLLAGLHNVGVESNMHQYKSTDMAHIVTVQVCQIVIAASVDDIDYAIVAADRRDASEDARDAERAVQDFCRQQQAASYQQAGGGTGATSTMAPSVPQTAQVFTTAPTPSPAMIFVSSPSAPTVTSDPWDDEDDIWNVAPTLSPASVPTFPWPTNTNGNNATGTAATPPTNATTDSGGLRHKIKQFITTTQSSMESDDPATLGGLAMLVVGLALLLVFCCGGLRCWCRRSCRRRREAAAAKANGSKADETTIASFFSSKLY